MDSDSDKRDRSCSNKWLDLKVEIDKPDLLDAFFVVKTIRQLVGMENNLGGVICKLKNMIFI